MPRNPNYYFVLTTLCVLCLLQSCNSPNTTHDTSTSTINDIDSTHASTENGLLIAFQNSVTDAQARQLIQKQGGRVIKRIANQALYHVAVPSDWSSEAALQRFQPLPQVRFAELNVQYSR